MLATDATTTDVNFGSVTYGNPSDNTWGEYLYTYVAARFQITAPGATTAATLQGWVSTVEAKASSMTTHMLVSPPRTLKVNNQAATAPLSGVGTTPTLSWTAPTTGTASTYQILVYRVYNTAGTTTGTTVAAFFTDQTSMVIPPNVLTAGNSYQFRVRAVSDPNANYAVAPWQTSLPYGDATAYTALVAP